MAASQPSSTVHLQGEATTTKLQMSHTPELSNKCMAPSTVSPSKSSAPQDVVEDGRPLYLGNRRQQVTSGIFFLLLLVSWLAVVLTHVGKDHSADPVVRPPPSHMSDYPLPPDSGALAFSAVANETVDTASATPTAVRSKNVARTKSTARSRKSTAATSAWNRLQLWRESARNVTAPPSHSGRELGSASEAKKNLWCAYNGSDSRFKSHHLPLQLCSAVLLCCLTLTTPAGEPSANNLRFAEFLKLQDTNGTTRPSLMVALGGPQQDPGVLHSLAQRDHGNASKRLAEHVLHFVEFNRLDGVLLYALHCGPDEVAVFQALYERLDYHGYTVAVTCPDGEGGPKMFADAKIGPVVLIPASANASRTQCPRGLARRVLDDGESTADVMLGIRLSGVRYTLPAGGEAISREGAAASLVSSAAYRDVCLAIKYADQVVLA
ncbi:hypothetical protein HPB52_000578 [Rhipicephalus sanguineus]|uniref:Uncharacterized protein n=1 Tax=Rhipicephalus sanguineus TaxID=34632 RepID=A0A9D4QBG1_RHISA|nr:hypothetical protein HPB52_000578 [Rhipicephalus sanguineus]